MSANHTPTVSIKTPDEFRCAPKEYQELVLHQLRQHAEGELVGAYDYLYKFLPIAPNAIERKICCERAAEELDHFIRASDVLRGIGFDTSPMIHRSIEQRKYYKTEGVESVNSWLMRGLFSYIGEAAVLSIIEEMAHSSYSPIAEMARQVIVDEYIHVANGKRIVEDYIRVHGVSPAQPDFESAWSMSLDLFGRSDSERSKSYLKWGLRRRSNSDARDFFILKMRPELEGLGFRIPESTECRKFL